ncbi:MULTISPECIES: hypothetical protein [unclassified Microcoleus]|uniref:hypothetical protein n=1 Tax=unclassified Microcoleus TaxID=2642155 RepID=UPI0025D4CC5F|nr:MULTISPECIES: hypothetical protein [unclassified Microcoleus]
MKLKLAISGLLIALLVGCNDTTTTVAPTVSPSAAANPTSNPVVSEPTPTATSNPVASEPTPTATPTPVASEPAPTPTNSPNPFDSDSFPKAGCGDTIPTDKKTDTVKLYPVFVDYSDSNLKTIKANYCGDALKITTKDKGKYVIQVASFTDEKRVNQFKEFLARKLENTSVEVGEVTVIGTKPIQKSTKNVAEAAQPTGDEQSQDKKANKLTSISNSASSIGKAAQLTPKQIKELIEMENRQTVRVDQSNLKLQKVKVILPTYVPSGFEVKDFKISLCDNPGENADRYSYDITYSNSSNSSFNIQTRPCRVRRSDPTVVKDIQLPSEKFDRVNLKLTKFDKSKDDTQISGEILSSDSESPGSFQNLLSLTSNGSNSVNWQEAQKIIKSMDYLNQN